MKEIFEMLGLWSGGKSMGESTDVRSSQLISPQIFTDKSLLLCIISCCKKLCDYPKDSGTRDS